MIKNILICNNKIDSLKIRVLVLYANKINEKPYSQLLYDSLTYRNKNIYN